MGWPGLVPMSGHRLGGPVAPAAGALHSPGIGVSCAPSSESLMVQGRPSKAAAVLLESRTRRCGVLQIHLLGHPQLSVDCRPTHGFRTQALLCLIAYLAIHQEQDCDRDELATLLWPVLSASAALDNLRHALWLTRRYLGPAKARVASNRRTVRLTSDAQVDVTDFLALAGSDAPEDLLSAVNLFRGRPLSGIDGDWVDVFRRRLELTYRLLLERVCPWLSYEGRHAEAVHYSQTLVELDPLDEAARRIAMRAAAQGHHVEEARRQYNEILRLLRAELGIAPDSRTQQTFSEVTASSIRLEI